MNRCHCIYINSIWFCSQVGYCFHYAVIIWFEFKRKNFFYYITGHFNRIKSFGTMILNSIYYVMDAWWWWWWWWWSENPNERKYDRKWRYFFFFVDPTIILFRSSIQLKKETKPNQSKKNLNTHARWQTK